MKIQSRCLHEIIYTINYSILKMIIILLACSKYFASSLLQFLSLQIIYSLKIIVNKNFTVINCSITEI